MVDRGFKKMESMILAKGCEIIRPPSVSNSKQVSKEQVMENVMEWSVVEKSPAYAFMSRDIRQIREFKFLALHACIQHSLIQCADDVISVVCGLINLQSTCLTRCW